MANTVKPYCVVADGQAATHSKTLAAAVRSAEGFAPCFKSLEIRLHGKLVQVIR
jgi:hypothetical protein